jgi:glycosyltransferase involved in cell wall biosynthesis
VDLKHLLVVPCPWTEAGEATELAASDIGISWMPDDAWSRGKCGLKVLQYMAAGLPVVANPVGIHTELIENGVTGFLADSNEAWVQAVERLVRDPGLRSRIGQAGRRLVSERYGLNAGAQSWLELMGKPAARAAA